MQYWWTAYDKEKDEKVCYRPIIYRIMDPKPGQNYLTRDQLESCLTSRIGFTYGKHVKNGYIRVYLCDDDFYDAILSFTSSSNYYTTKIHKLEFTNSGFMLYGYEFTWDDIIPVPLDEEVISVNFCSYLERFFNNACTHFQIDVNDFDHFNKSNWAKYDFHFINKPNLYTDFWVFGGNEGEREDLNFVISAQLNGKIDESYKLELLKEWEETNIRIMVCQGVGDMADFSIYALKEIAYFKQKERSFLFLSKREEVDDPTLDHSRIFKIPKTKEEFMTFFKKMYEMERTRINKLRTDSSSSDEGQ